MDNQRLLTWGLFIVLVWMTYQTWTLDYGPKPVPTQEAVEPLAAGDEEAEALPAFADTDTTTDAGGLPTLDAEPAAAPSPATAAAITVRTDVLEVEISTEGGTLRKAALVKYPVNKDEPDILVELLSPEAGNLGLIQSGLRQAGDGPEPNHQALFAAEGSNYELGGGQDEIVVPLRWTNDAGLTVQKTYRFTRGSYIIGLEQTVTNRSGADWRGAAYTRLQRRNGEIERSMFNVDTYSFDGPVIYDGEKTEKLNRDDLIDDGPLDLQSDNGWVAAIQHHFLSAAVPTAGEEQRYRIAHKNDVVTLTAIGGAVTVPAGSDKTFATALFVGPKLQAQLERVAPSLKLTVDYGWLTIISQPLFWLLSKIYGFVANWGVAIILVTVLIKILFYKLTQSSGRSMAKMRELQPRMQALQERYKDDRQGLSQAMMDLYKREKVNPAAGCLPILIQMPFFLAFYWVLLESVEMRQAPFALWITDLSARDPYFILPLIMGAAMLLQQKLNPAPTDPVQAKVMQIMPIMFTGFFAFFPSGLVLYWVTNTVLSIAQQWRINKVVEQESKKAKSG
jgi:YidC/Oxa1 family membrane protein insertase